MTATADDTDPNAYAWREGERLNALRDGDPCAVQNVRGCACHDEHITLTTPCGACGCPPEPEPEAGDTAAAAVDHLSRLGTRSALLNAIKARVEKEARLARGELEDAMRAARRELGTKAVDVTVPDDLAPEGTAVAATVGFNRDGKATVIVTRPEECVEWVAERTPQWIREVVDPVYLANLLKTLVPRPGGVVTDAQGEVIPWAASVPGAPGAMTVKFTDNDAGQDALIGAWLAGELGDVQVRALPGPARDD